MEDSSGPREDVAPSQIGDSRAHHPVIAHRLATIRGTDRIVVFDRGRIIEEGSFDALVASGGPFAALARAQFMTGADAMPTWRVRPGRAEDRAAESTRCGPCSAPELDWRYCAPRGSIAMSQTRRKNA